jgi:hypothetical protein
VSRRLPSFINKRPRETWHLSAGSSTPTLRLMMASRMSILAYKGVTLKTPPLSSRRSVDALGSQARRRRNHPETARFCLPAWSAAPSVPSDEG